MNELKVDLLEDRRQLQKKRMIDRTTLYVSGTLLIILFTLLYSQVNVPS